jgi:hypothetical protein
MLHIACQSTLDCVADNRRCVDRSLGANMQRPNSRSPKSACMFSDLLTLVFYKTRDESTYGYEHVGPDPMLPNGKTICSILEMLKCANNGKRSK